MLKYMKRLWTKNKTSKGNILTFHNHFVTHPLPSCKSSLATPHPFRSSPATYILTIKHPSNPPNPLSCQQTYPNIFIFLDSSISQTKPQRYSLRESLNYTSISRQKFRHGGKKSGRNPDSHNTKIQGTTWNEFWSNIHYKQSLITM
jgi:hypothetical protein